MAVSSLLKSTGKMIAEPLICVGVRAVVDIPAEGAARWVKSRFHDHSQALPRAIAAANDRAWQAVGLALAGDTLLGRIAGLFRDGDLKAVQHQIRAFVTDADTGLDGQPAGLRAKACDELNQLKQAGHLSAEPARLESVDLTRFADTAKVEDDAHRAVRHIADSVAADCPHLSKVLALVPPSGGTPLLAAAFAYFLRRQIATNAELARELAHDQLRLLSQKQQAGFNSLELALGDKFDSLEATLGGWFATTDATLDEILSELKRFRDANQVTTRPESPLRVSVTNEAELQRLKKLRDRMREQPAELIDAELQSLLGDGLAATGQFADAVAVQQAAADAAKEDGDPMAEAEAAYKQFKAACESKQWDAALAALNRAVALDPKRFRPVPRHYDTLSILGAGAFGVVLKCRNTILFDRQGNALVCAVKTFREADLDQPLNKVFAEATTLKHLASPHVIRVLDHGFADADGQQRPFLAMEYFDGQTLEDWLAANGRLAPDDFRAVFGMIAAALNAAHDEGVIHRDVKPSNVMLRKDGNRWIVKVIDFGLAVKPAVRTTSRLVSQNVPLAQRSAHDQSVTGTGKYAAPEQLGERPYPVGPHSDVFAFGNTALDALFGTVKPGPKHWKQLPDELTELLARCADEEFRAANPDEGRLHHFGPVLVALSGEQRDARPPVVPPPPPVAATPASGTAVPPPATEPVATTACPRCQQRIDYPVARLGKKFFCPLCTKAMQLPEQAGQPATWRTAAPPPPPPPPLPPPPAPVAEPMATTTCPRCQKRIEFPVARLGKKFFCPLCTKAMQLPEHAGLPATWRATAPPPPLPPPPPPAKPAIPPPPLAKPAAPPSPPATVKPVVPPPVPDRFSTNCPNCKKKLRFKRSAAGQKLPCPECKVQLIYPKTDGGVATVAPTPRATRVPAPLDDDSSEFELVLEAPTDEIEFAAPPSPVPTTPLSTRVPAQPVRPAGFRREIALPGGEKMIFAWCPPGTFQMGSPQSESGRDANEYRHWVTFRHGFWMGIHPVTQGQWMSLMGSNPSMHTSDFRPGLWGLTGDAVPAARRPVEKVTWDMAQEFCAEVRSRTGTTVQLPTEAEWEYACRAGTGTAFCNGDDPAKLAEVAWYGSPRTAAVCQHKPNAWGIYDCHGNVWEWCSDWFEPDYRAAGGLTDSTASRVDPTGPATGTFRVIRGGGGNDNEVRFHRSAYRYRRTPGYYDSYLGLRVVADADAFR